MQVLVDLEEAEQAAAQTSLVPRGTIKLTCGQSFGLLYLAPAMAEFLERYPEVKFDVSLSDRVVDLVEEGFDLGVRIGALGPANLIARKLGETKLIACASRAYLEKHGTPRVPEDLGKHNCVTYAYVPDSNVWRFRDPEGVEQTVTVSGNLHANNGDLLTQAAVNGIGIVYEPDFIVGPALAARQVVRLLEGWEPAPLGIYAVYASRKHLSAKVRAFVDFMSARFGA